MAKICVKAATRGLGSPQLRLLHSAVAPGAPRAGLFRINRIWVGAADDPLSFVASQVDVEQHLRDVWKLYMRLDCLRRAVLLMYAMTVLHPFEDGNGRVMRAALVSLGIASKQDFVLFLAIYSKTEQSALVSGMSLLADNELAAMENFLERAMSDYTKLSKSNEEFIRNWVLNLEDWKVVDPLATESE